MVCLGACIAIRPNNMSQLKEMIVIFGGTFNPIHNGHILTVKKVQEFLGLSQVYFVPSFISVHKTQEIISFKHRYNMLKLALSQLRWATIDLCEFNRKGKSYSYDTVVYFKNQNPKAKIYLLIGQDSYQNFTTWYRWQDILSLVELLVIPRTIDIKINNELPAQFLPINKIDISASSIRAKIRSKTNLNEIPVKYLPANVFEYISQHELYQ